MRVTLTRSFTFEAAHALPHAPDGHRCRQVHGHSYRVDVSVSGSTDPETGWYLDYAVIVEAFEPLRRRLDHRTLNEVEGLENPTSENLAAWIWTGLKPPLPGLVEVAVHETPWSCCTYRGDD